MQTEDLRQSIHWADYLKSLGWEYVIIEGTLCYLKKIGPASLIKIQRPKELTPKTVALIDELALKNNAAYLKIEPLAESQAKLLEENGYIKSYFPMSPSKTVILDLSQDQEQIYKNFSQNAKRILNKTKTSFETKTHQNPNPLLVKEAYQVFMQSAQVKKFSLPSVNSIEKLSELFNKDSVIVSSYLNSQLVAATLSLVHKNKAYFMFGGTSHQGRLNKAGHSNMAETINYLKTLGITEFDLEGIYDERFPKTTESWLGFGHFKQMYCKNEVTFPYPYVKLYNKILKFLGSKIGNLPL